MSTVGNRSEPDFLETVVNDESSLGVLQWEVQKRGLREHAADIIQAAYLTARSAPVALLDREHAFRLLRQHVRWRCGDLRREIDKQIAATVSSSEVLQDENNQARDKSDGPEEVIATNEATLLLLDRLPPDGQAVLRGMRDGLQKQQIAECMGKSSATVSKWVKRIQKEAFKIFNTRKHHYGE